MALWAEMPEALYDVRRIDPLWTPAIAKLVAATEVVEDSTLDAAYPAAWGAHVRLELEGAPAREAAIDHPAGSAQRPFGWTELVSKTTRIAASNALSQSPVDDLGQVVRADMPVATVLELIE